MPKAGYVRAMPTPTLRAGWLGVKAATHVRFGSSKARRAAPQTIDPVLLPCSGELATLGGGVSDLEARLLWSGVEC